MIWAIVISRSCFCCLYRASPSLAAKNIINLILVLTICWCLCVESSLMLLEEGVCYDQGVLLAKLCYPLLCFILYSKAKLACYSTYLFTSYFYIPVYLCPGEGNGTPLQYFCLEDPMDGEAWWAAVHGVARVGHDWATSLSLFTFMHWRRKWQPTPVFLPGESQGRGTLVGCRLWGRTKSDTNEVT